MSNYTKLLNNLDTLKLFKIKDNIDTYINLINDKEKNIVLLRYFKQQTQAQVASKLGISQVQVSRIEKKILHSMKEKLIL